MTTEVLKKVEEKTLKPKEAYNQLYPKQASISAPKKAHFIKFGIYIPDSKGVTAFLKILFGLPLPIMLIRPFLKKALSKGKQGLEGFDTEELLELITTKGVSINVKSNDGVKIRIKTI